VVLQSVAKANGLELEIESFDLAAGGVPEEYKKINKLGKIPTFVGNDGYVLSECIAIAIYRKHAPVSVHSTARAHQAAFPYDEIYYHCSYPCLKTTVETYSHSEIHIHASQIFFPS